MCVCGWVGAGGGNEGSFQVIKRYSLQRVIQDFMLAGGKLFWDSKRMCVKQMLCK